MAAIRNTVVVLYIHWGWVISKNSCHDIMRVNIMMINIITISFKLTVTVLYVMEICNNFIDVTIDYYDINLTISCSQYYDTTIFALVSIIVVYNIMIL